MIQKLKLGDCLKELLQIRGWSAAQLAKTLNIDASYVRRWIQGNRTPALNSSYIDSIVEALCDGLDKDYKQVTRTAILIFIDKSEGPMDEEMPLDARVKRLLHEAQVYTLSLDIESRKSRKPADSQTVVSELLEITRRESLIIPPPQAVEWVHTLKMEQIPKVISTRETLLAAAITMLKKALYDGDSTLAGEIILTFQSEKEYFEGYPELHRDWQQTIIHALSLGWSVRHLCKLNKNVQRSLRLVNQILEWTNYSGAYSLYYFDKYGIDYPPYEIILVKGKGAIMGFATDNYKEIDAGLYLDEIGAVRIIENFVGQMFHNAEPLIHILSQNEYFDLNATKDRKSGNHLMCMHDLSYLTVPLPVMERYLLISIPEEKERRIHWRRIEDTIHSFYRDIRHYKMRHIYPMRAIEELVRTGQYHMNVYYRPTPEDIKAHLLHLIELLQTYDRFEIALVDENKYELINKAQYDIKGDHTIAIGIMPKYTTDHKVELISITEGTIVSAFQEYFDDMWERINPIYRDKEAVISWIREKLAILREE